jgi:hypothetical protein
MQQLEELEPVGQPYLPALQEMQALASIAPLEGLNFPAKQF